MSEELKRQEFEAWALKSGFKESTIKQRVGGDYFSQYLADYWHCWIAAWASRPEAESEMPVARAQIHNSLFTDEKEVGEYWTRKGYKVTPLYAAPVAGNAARDDARDAAVVTSIPLPGGHWIKREALSNGASTWLLRHADGARNRILESYECEFIDAAIKASKQGGEA